MIAVNSYCKCSNLIYLPDPARRSASNRQIRVSSMRVRRPSPLERSQSSTPGRSPGGKKGEIDPGRGSWHAAFVRWGGRMKPGESIPRRPVGPARLYSRKSKIPEGAGGFSLKKSPSVRGLQARAFARFPPISQAYRPALSNSRLTPLINRNNLKLRVSYISPLSGSLN